MRSNHHDISFGRSSKNVLSPREKIFDFHHVLKKLWTFEKNQQAIFGNLLTDGFFFCARVF